jgi:pimeloyl-ACP methyl ester carboxylesterase
MKNRRCSFRRASLAVCCAIGVAAATTSCTTKTPDKDTFYTTPGTGSGPNGTVLRSRTSKFAPGGNAKAWQVVYRSTNALGGAMAVSGTVLVPGTAWSGQGARPLVTYGVGTRGLGDQCAPSYTIANGGDYENGIFGKLLAKGYAVAITDMEGLGTPGGHTYMVGQSQGRAALDMARAALRLPGTGLSPTAPVGVMGYSQGGATAGWAAELAPTYAPELHLEGVAMGGVPADLLAVSNGLDGSTFVAFGLLAALGYDAAYPDLHLQTYMNDRGRQLYQNSQSTCLVSLNGIGTFLGVSGTRLTDYATTDPRLTPEWQRRLGENKLGTGRPTVPVYQYHGQQDELVEYAQGNTLHETYCAKGVNLTWKAYPNQGHPTLIFNGADEAITFLTDRFNHVPTTGNC